MSEKYYVGRDVTSFQDTGTHDPITRVTLYVDDKNCYTAGDDTGKELSASCPSATQAMADAILAELKGYEYRSYSADAANLDPAAELGDGITACGVYSVYSKSADGGDGFPNVSAPGEKALDEEYPMPNRAKQYTDRQTAQTRSLITKTAEKISLEVSDLAGKYTDVSVTLDGLTVTDPNGTTRIRGNMIETDTLYVNAANIKGTLTANQVVLTGSITFEDLNSDVSGSISDAQSTADGAASTASSAWVVANKINNGLTNGGTVINKAEIYSPNIYAREFSVIPVDKTGFSEYGGAFNLFGYYEGTTYEFFSIKYFHGGIPYVTVTSAAGATCNWFTDISFYGSVEFESAEVHGLTATFG